jgi:hypothetical protein
MPSEQQSVLGGSLGTGLTVSHGGCGIKKEIGGTKPAPTLEQLARIMRIQLKLSVYPPACSDEQF